MSCIVRVLTTIYRLTLSVFYVYIILKIKGVVIGGVDTLRKIETWVLYKNVVIV